MFTHARWGCWETNSSTFNQIAIRPDPVEETTLIPQKVVLNYDFPSDSGDMITEPVHKIRLVWAMLKEIRQEWEWYGSSERLASHAEDYDVDKFEEIFYGILDRYGISYEVESDENDDVGILGMSGMTHNAALLFLGEGNLERFLFNPKSMFTFGIENAWPGPDELGYTDESSDGYDIIEV